MRSASLRCDDGETVSRPCAKTAVVMPRALAGQFEVWPQKVDAAFPFPIMLGPTPSNYTQDLYLLSNAAIAVLGGLFVTRSDVDPRRLLHTYWGGAVLVAGDLSQPD